MTHSSRSGLILLAGVVLLIATGVANAVFIDARLAVYLLGIGGIVLCAWGAYGSRAGIGELVRQRRGEVALYTIGLVGILILMAWLSARFPVRFDMTENRQFSLSPATEAMLDRLEKPVHVVFFNDRMMRETTEIYEQMARRTNKLTVEFFDPMLNPAQARMRGVEFAGTAIFESEGRKLTVNGPTETDIANGILRISQGVQQTVCFLDGHGEPDPFSLESHDHTESNAGHSHGLGSKLVLHERHGIAKARHGLEAMNYVVQRASLLQGVNDLAKCSVLVVAGPKIPLLPAEVKAIDKYLVDGGNALFMLDPFIKTGIEPVLLQYGIVPDEDIVLDEASHFWADISAPAVTDYNRHEVTRELPLTFFPGVRSLSPTSERVPGTDVRPVINSSRKSYGGTDRERANFDPKTSKPGPLTLMVTANRRPNFVESTEAVVRRLRDGNPQAQSEASKESAEKAKNVSRIAVIGDSDFATNSFFHILGNGTLFLNTVNFLASKENLIGLEPKTYDLPHVNLTNTQMNGTFFLSIVFIPALMAVIGLIVWWRQR